MAKRASRRRATASPLLAATVTTIGSRPKITIGQRSAPVADVGISVTGGAPATRVTVTFTITLSIRLAATGTATLVDETGSSRSVSALKAGASYIFENVLFPAPVSARRVFRITNLRANAAQFAESAATPAPIAYWRRPRHSAKRAELARALLATSDEISC